MTQANPTSAATAAFKLPEGVKVNDDGKLVDSRRFYQGITMLGNDSISTLQKAFDENAKGSSEGFSWKTPFTFCYNIVATVTSAIVDAFKAVFGLCFDYSGSEGAEDAAKTTPKETPKT